MFCPKCSQNQVSEDVRYCSRCGLPLEAVSEAISARGSIYSVRDARRTTLIGFGLVTLSGLFLLATLIIGTPEPSFIVQLNLLISLLLFLSALGYVSYKFFSGSKPDRDHADLAPTSLKANTTKKLLDEAETSGAVGAYEYFPRRNPEPVAVDSVTEETTNLLNSD